MEKVSSTIKGIGGIIVYVMTMIFGRFWFLFMAYLVANVIDWLTGWAKAKKKNEGSSKKGIKGIIKKTGYWVIIAVGFGCSFIFINIGEILSINLGFMIWVGWFTLATLLVNEFVSILENLKELGYKVPEMLIRGLKISGDAIDMAVKKILKGDDADG